MFASKNISSYWFGGQVSCSSLPIFTLKLFQVAFRPRDWKKSANSLSSHVVYRAHSAQLTNTLMQIRRTNNQRRRILSLEDGGSSPVSETSSDLTVEMTPRTETTSTDCKSDYSKRARRRYQLRTTDLIPKRAWSVTAVILLLMSVVIGIILLDGAASGWEHAIGAKGVKTLSIGSESSLSNWFSSFLLILTALGCLQVFLLRQHRSDDYRGVYRWWLWMALILILASLNAVTGIFNVGLTLVGHLFDRPENFSVGWGWALVKFSILAVFIARFGFEMRVSRGAVAGCCVVFLIYASAIFVGTFELPTLAEQYKLTYGNLMMFGKIAVFSAVLLYSRFIYLDAHGLVKQRVRAEKPVRKKATKKKEPKGKKQTATRKETEKPSPQKTEKSDRKKRKPEPAAEKKSRKSKSESKVAASESPKPTKPSKPKSDARREEHDRELQAEIDELQSRNLSKSERRRLRKLQRRQGTTPGCVMELGSVE